MLTFLLLGSVSVLSANYQSYGYSSYSPTYYSQDGYSQGQYSNPYSSSDYSYSNDPYSYSNDYYYQQPYSQGYEQTYDNNQYYYQQPRQYSQSQQYYQQQPRQYSQSQQYYQQQPRQYSQNKQSYYQQQTPNRAYSQGQQHDQYGNNYASQSNSDEIRTDQDISNDIRDSIGSGWFSKGYEHVSFDVNNGIVTLSGSVESLENKKNVEEKVSKIDGVKQVRSQITISKAQVHTSSESDLMKTEQKYPQDFAATNLDRQLNAKIRDKISGGWFSKANETIIIRTTNGVVVISGTVEKPEDIQKLDDQINEINGIRSVNNQLTAKKR